MGFIKERIDDGENKIIKTGIIERILMPLLIGSREFEEELETLVKDEIHSDSETTRYLAHLFANVTVPRWEEIRWYWSGLRKETPSEEDRPYVFREKLDLSRKVGDGCLALCAFYNGDERPNNIKVVPIPIEEPLQEPIPTVDKRRFANEYVPVPFDKPSRNSKPVEPGLEIAGLGRAGYHTAGFYSAVLGQETHPYPTLAQIFPLVIVKVGPAILREYLGAINPPQRIILYTPRGELIFRLRTSLS